MYKFLFLGFHYVPKFLQHLGGIQVAIFIVKRKLLWPPLGKNFNHNAVNAVQPKKPTLYNAETSQSLGANKYC
jgi:hypothetical protein